MLDPALDGGTVGGGMADGMEGDGKSVRLGLNGNTGEGVRWGGAGDPNGVTASGAWRAGCPSGVESRRRGAGVIAALEPSDCWRIPTPACTRLTGKRSARATSTLSRARFIALIITKRDGALRRAYRLPEASASRENVRGRPQAPAVEPHSRPVRSRRLQPRGAITVRLLKQDGSHFHR